MAAHTYNAAWDALEVGEYESAVALAKESLRLWTEIGSPRELSMGEWMVGRTQAFAGDFAAARVAAELAEEHLNRIGGDAEDWLHASVAELHARAHSNQPDLVTYQQLYETAKTLISRIADSEDRALIEAQFSDLPEPSNS